MSETECKNNTSYDDLIKIGNQLAEIYRREFNGYRPKNDLELAGLSMLKRCVSQARAINLLILNDFTADAAIIARSLMNLMWLFLFTLEVHRRNEKWEFEENPLDDSVQFRRARRYLDWLFVEEHRRGVTSEYNKSKVDEILKKHGWISIDDLPRHWWHEPSVKINSIKRLAKYVGAELQYEDDYSFLSSVEHGGMQSLALMMENFNNPDSKYNRYAQLKSLQFVGMMMDIAMGLTGKAKAEDFQTLADWIGTLSTNIKEEMNSN